MSNLDDVHEILRTFRTRIEAFSETLQTSHREMLDRHEEIAGEWTDTAAREYHSRYDPLSQLLDNYINITGPAYYEFLKRKIEILDQYLHTND
jgi:hypothetical protein